jgi:membrane protein
MAQAIAYTALFALVPLTLVGVAMLAFIYGTSEGITRAHAVIELYVPQIQDLVAANLDAIVRYRGVTGLVGAVGLVWSGKNLFQALAYALNRTLGVQRYRPFIWDVAVALVLVPFVGVVLIVATALPVMITLIVQFAGLESLRWVPQIASYATSAALVFVVSALLYAYLPNRRPQWDSVCLGAAICALLYSIAQIAFAVYTSYAAYAFAIYGALSALVVLLLWLYLIGIIFLFGAHVSAVWEKVVDADTLSLAS